MAADRSPDHSLDRSSDRLADRSDRPVAPAAAAMAAPAAPPAPTEDIQRWTAGRKAVVVLDLIRGRATTAGMASASPAHFTVAEVGR